MCMEDIQIGRESMLGRQVSLVDSATITAVFPANADRIGIIISARELGVTGKILIMNDPTIPTAIAAIDAFIQPRLVLRIEEYGQAVMLPIWTKGSVTGLFWVYTELILRTHRRPLVSQ